MKSKNNNSFINEPWDGYTKWKKEAEKIERENAKNTKMFGMFSFLFCCLGALHGLLSIWVSAIRDSSGVGPIVGAILGTLIIGAALFMAAHMFEVIGVDVEDEEEDKK
jgi:hypothetical protein